MTLALTPLDKAPEPELGHAPIPKERYTSAAYATREWQHMWTRTWLLAGREADVEKPGDFFTFEIGPESIIVTRDRTQTLRAHYNVCQHRGNLLCDAGRGNTPTFTCRYHAWDWNLDGTLRSAQDATTFPQGIPTDMRLAPVRIDTWGGWVWINLDPDAEPLLDYLGVLPAHLAPYHFERQALIDDVTLEIECNWKTSVDAFNEAYHVASTHPQLLDFTDDVNVQIDLYGLHSRFIFPVGLPSPRVARRVRAAKELPEAMRALILPGCGIDPATFTGTIDDVRDAVWKATREQAVGQGVDLSDLRDEQLLDDYHYTIFPNVTLNIHGRGFWLFRHRPHPTDPNRMFFDFQDHWYLPPGTHPPRPAQREYTANSTSLGEVMDQDLHNLSRVQAGMRSRAFGGLFLGAQERRIRHFHHVLEGYLNGAPS